MDVDAVPIWARHLAQTAGRTCAVPLAVYYRPMGGGGITVRQRQILTAVVENYIATGEAVSSGAIARALGTEGAQVSSATVRNEMAQLSDAGLLEQPHTSAGRIPSAQAFRLYVQSLGGQATPGSSGFKTDLLRLGTDAQTTIDSRLAGVAGTQAMLARTSGVLAALSSGVGLAIGALAATDTLEHIHFTRLADHRVLAVVVGRSGTVRDRVLAVAEDLSATQLETAANFLNEHFRGWQLERVRAELLRRIENERTVYLRMMEAAERLWTGAVPAAAAFDGERTVFIEGVANLLGGSTRLGEKTANGCVSSSLRSRPSSASLRSWPPTSTPARRASASSSSLKSRPPNSPVSSLSPPASVVPVKRSAPWASWAPRAWTTAPPWALSATSLVCSIAFRRTPEVHGANISEISYMGRRVSP